MTNRDGFPSKGFRRSPFQTGNLVTSSGRSSGELEVIFLQLGELLQAPNHRFSNLILCPVNQRHWIQFSLEVLSIWPFCVESPENLGLIDLDTFQRDTAEGVKGWVLGKNKRKERRGRGDSLGDSLYCVSF